MSGAIAIVIDQRVLRCEQSCLLIPVGSQFGCVIEYFEHREAAILIRIRCLVLESGDQVLGKRVAFCS